MAAVQAQRRSDPPPQRWATPAGDPIGDLISRTDGDFNRNYLEPLLRSPCWL
jgi:hypothetical protein